MNPDRQQAINYLRGPADGLWRWAEDGAVLVWRDGSTIAFREEIERILEWLTPNGLPSFGSIVFLLAACRGKVPCVDDIVVESNAPLPPKMGQDAVLLVSARRQLKAQLEFALAQLAKLSQLPAELNTGLKARCVLAEAVFEPARAERHVDARTVLRGLRELASDAELTDEESPNVRGSYLRQIQIVAEGLKRHTAESLALRMRTGLDALPKGLEVDLPTAERARRLIEELSHDREIGAVARAARELMAAVRLPRRLAVREELAVGGVADITNRGPLDRLLLSELAHDDLTLAVRVALNEALYLRREPPMREPPGTLALLLDSGVRLWGVPRVLATAVALALIARDKQHCDVRAWRAHGRQLLPLDLLSRHGLTQHLGALETNAHPGDALPAFAEAIASGPPNQSVLITHRDTLDDPEFRRALAAQPASPGFVAVVDREGRFELHALPLARRTALCEAELNLSSVFDPQSSVPPIRVEADPTLPAIFGVRPFPFLLPVAGKVDYWIEADDGYTYATLNDRWLVQFRNQEKGGRELASDLPTGKTVWLDVVNGMVHLVKLGTSQQPARLISLPLPGGPLRVTDLVTGPDLLAVHRDGDVILLIRQQDVRAHALSDGRLLGRVLNPLRWVHGRYFRGESQFHFVAWDGTALNFEPVTLPAIAPAASVALVFDRAGLDGPWLLTRNGVLISTATDEESHLPDSGRLQLTFDAASVSKDGHQILVPGRSKFTDPRPMARVFHLRHDQQMAAMDDGPVTGLSFDACPRLPTWNLIRVVEAITRWTDGLAFRCPKNRWHRLVSGDDDSIRIFGLLERGHDFSEAVTFAESRATGQGCFLQTAQWPNGSQAFLDSRGLLHLKSHDPAVPEISLVLSDGEVAGWTSDGHLCGPPFFFDGAYHTDPEPVFERLQQFLNCL